ncbi:YlbL family protein [Peterkaempfera bronchialis]|uniref:endopeptidase La n=1 Tax=Peterkaempfera bronchialis TaxID=2126346 RepID=A0A345T056_9ACTN|nr:PDZ domain-containing protein [Peterkaempfera bronchialis]AXI79361.1 PDZ domain-containing protein [Peterkaempfera bronchialis]
MPRRSATMLAATLLLIAMLCASVLPIMKVPYAEMSPGPTYNTLGQQNGKAVISITGRQTYPTTGHLNMTTVQVTSADYQPSLVSVVIGWLRDDVTVVPHDNLYPNHQSEEEAEQQNAEEFASSQDSAKTAALRELGYKIATNVIVDSVIAGSPSQGKLHAGDVIKAVDDTVITEPDQVAEVVSKLKSGQQVVFTVVPDGKPAGDAKKVTITTVKAPDGNRAMVGIQPGTRNILPFTIDIGLQDVGGPSAGLMFSLGIIDKLKPTDITGGKFIAGTGTISDTGQVGPIGGIAMKTIAARNAGAQYFLTPADNCAEAAKDTPGGLTLVKVKTLDSALKALDAIRAGDTSALPSCTR